MQFLEKRLLYFLPSSIYLKTWRTYAWRTWTWRVVQRVLGECRGSLIPKLAEAYTGAAKLHTMLLTNRKLHNKLINTDSWAGGWRLWHTCDVCVAAVSIRVSCSICLRWEVCASFTISLKRAGWCCVRLPGVQCWGRYFIYYFVINKGHVLPLFVCTHAVEAYRNGVIFGLFM